MTVMPFARPKDPHVKVKLLYAGFFMLFAAFRCHLVNNT